MPHVSVIVPLYNAQRYIARCIESVLHQTHADWELVIVDDGSTDRSAEIACGYAQQDQRISVLFHEAHANKGVSVTRRKAIDHSHGPYIALLDADDLFAPTKLEQQLRSAARHPECIVYHCGAQCIDADGAIIAGPTWADAFNAFARQERVYSFRDDEAFLQRNSVLNSSALVRAVALQQQPFGFDQLFQYEDWTLWVLLAGQGPFFVQPDSLVQYRVHDASATTKVVQSPLVAIYSHIEFLLSVIAFTSDQLVHDRATKVVETMLAEAVKQYGATALANNLTAPFTATLDAARLAIAPKPQRRKWYRRFLWPRSAPTGA